MSTFSNPIKRIASFSARASAPKALALCGAVLLAGAGCGGGEQRTTAHRSASSSDPDVLTFSLVPAEDSEKELSMYKPLVAQLERMTGKKVKFYMPTSYASVVEAMLGGWVDIAVMGPYSYVIASERDPRIEVFATYTKRAGHLQKKGPGYRAVLLTKKGSPFNSATSLKGATLALVDPASTSGNLVPRVLFAKELACPFDSYFKRVVYTGGHDLSTLAVKEGRVDAAFVATHRFDTLVDKGLVRLEDFNVVWRSPVIPLDPFVWRTTLNPELRGKIKKAFLTLHENPEAKHYLDNVHSDGFMPMSPSDYDVMRTLQKQREQKD